MTEPTFTGWVRRRSTSLRVKVADAVARVLITVAGLATIVAVAGMCVFLVAVVIPLFLPGEVETQAARPPLRDAAGRPPVRLELDEYQTLGVAVFADGEAATFDPRTGTVLERRRLAGDAVPTAIGFAPTGGIGMLGFADGTVRQVTLRFASEFIEPSRIEPEFRGLAVGESKVRDRGAVQRTPSGSFRVQVLAPVVRDPVKVSEHPIRLVDLSMQSSGPIFAAFSEDGRLHVQAVTVIRNMMTRAETQRLSGGSLEVDLAAQGGRLPAHLLLEGRADSALLAWADGTALRFDTRDRATPALAESFRLLDEAGESVTAMGFLIGKTTVVVGDSLGRVSTWFRVRPSDPAALQGLVDGSRFERVHLLPGAGGGAVEAIAASSRTRMLAAGFAEGDARLYFVTNERLLAECPPPPGQVAPIAAIAIAPKDDALYAASRDGLWSWRLDIPHPQTTLASIFGKVWYEGYEHPEHVWQSSAGTDEFEPKFGLIPLIFGSLKATLYAMLFGTPLAILAAIYTSEFMHPSTRARVKPAIEIMASLPSVVLGFLAALVFAPIVERAVPAIVVTVFTVPFMVLLGAHLWQFLPTARASRLAALRIPAAIVAAAAGVLLAFLLAPAVERWCFGGDVMAWLSARPDATGDAERFASGAGGWLFILLPLSAIATWRLQARQLAPIRHAMAGMPRPRAAAVSMLVFLGSSGATLLLAWVMGLALDAVGFDPRGGVVDTYVQRNALVVGFVMGFAVIPIIYTIAEDALSSVPEHLRSGSLGLGATPWQTATRIVVPTAMSGIFSAVMIGLGRAVGETMIVLMAAGNTPILEWNIFSGFRTLSANIAVELPEAVQHSTEYRMLFLAALSLFVLTFVVNTFAEAVRQRFRKRAFAL